MSDKSKSIPNRKIKKTRTQPTQHKKMVPVRIKDYVDPTTGEVESFKLKKQEDRDFNFYKYWPNNLIEFKKNATLQERDFFDWLRENSNRDNLVVATYKVMAKRYKHSYRFVEKTIHKLIDTNVIVKVQNGVYLINPNVIFKGSTTRRHQIREQYKDLKKKHIKSHRPIK